jgi:carboxymethylenebutenolidase
MQQMNASDFHPEVMRLFDKYVHGLIDRRGFLDAQRSSRDARRGGALDLLRPNYSEAAQVVKPDDSRIKTQLLDYDSPGGAGKMRGLFAEPANRRTPVGGIVVVHENRGLNPHIQDIVRRFAVAGFVAFGPDALFPLGGYPGTDEAGVEMQRKRDGEQMNMDFVNAAKFLKSRPEVNGKIGATGFCFGGSVTNQLAVRLGSDLAAAVPFYGDSPAPRTSEDQGGTARQLRRNGRAHQRGVAGLRDGAQGEQRQVPGVLLSRTQHGFNNDTPPRFNKAQSDIAMERTIALFTRTLKTT